MYRDDDNAAQLRIQSLEAKLAEREAALLARDAEIAELRADLERAGKGPRGARRRRWPIVVAGGLCAIASTVCGVLLTRPSPPPPIAANGTGDPVCDLYLSLYQAHIEETATPATRAALQSALETQRAAFRSVASKPGAREALESSCLQAMATLTPSPPQEHEVRDPAPEVRIVRLESEPAGAHIDDDGVEVCMRTPCVVYLSGASARVEHRLALHKNGYQASRVTVGPGDEKVTVKLQPML